MNRKAEQIFLKFLTEEPQTSTFCDQNKRNINKNESLLKKVQIYGDQNCSKKLKTQTQEIKESNKAISKARQAIDKLKSLKIKNMAMKDAIHTCTEVQGQKQDSLEGKITSSYSYSTASNSFIKPELRKTGHLKEQYIFVNNSNKLGSIIIFKIIKYLNEGFFGKVYLVEEIKSKFIYSIKIIPRSSIKKGQQQNIIRQIKIQTYLNHPNIIKLYNFSIDQENIYLIMEPFLGKDLFASIKNQKIGFSENDISTILKQVVSAVQYMHKENVIHRDLKPQNILFCDKTAKICDFGWSIYSSDLRKTICGTPLYTSPEMLKQQSYNQKIDIWSIGLLAYQLLVEKQPFEIKDIHSMNNILNQELIFPDSRIISADAKNLIMECTKKDHRERLNINQLKQHKFLQVSKKYRCTIF